MREQPDRWSHPQVLRSRLAQIQAKYDGGGMPLAVYEVCRNLECEIAWAEHKEAELEARH